MPDSEGWVRELHQQMAPGLAAALDRHNEEGSLLTNALLHDALRERATDVHLDPQGQGILVRFRVDGAMIDVTMLGRDTGERLIRHFKVVAGLDVSATFKPEDARIRHDLGERALDMRLAFAPAVRGLKLSIRLLDPARIRLRLSTLGFSKSIYKRIREWMGNGTGTFLVTGPTGSGKTTTLYAVLHELNARPRSVITVEDPVEYQVDGVTQIQVNNEQGLTMALALRSMLRLDPDYLLLGEIRDGESARIALSAAGSGRALLSTLHTRDAVGTVTALRNYGLSDYEISSTLELVIAQRLVRRLCGACSRMRPLTERAREWLDVLRMPGLGKSRTAEGCDACRGLGYRGRIGLYEAWRLTPEDHRAILEHVDEHALRDQLANRKHRTLLTDGFKKVQLGLTSLAEISTISLPSLGAAELEPLEDRPGADPTGDPAPPRDTR